MLNISQKPASKEQMHQDGKKINRRQNTKSGGRQIKPAKQSLPSVSNNNAPDHSPQVMSYAGATKKCPMRPVMAAIERRDIQSVPPVKRNRQKMPYITEKSLPTVTVHTRQQRHISSTSPSLSYTLQVDRVLGQLSAKESDAHYPVQWCLTVVEELDKLHHVFAAQKSENYQYLKAQSAPIFSRTLASALTFLKLAIDHYRGHEFFYIFNETVLPNVFFDGNARIDGTPINKKIKSILHRFINTEMEYLRSTLPYPAKEGVTPVISKLKRLLMLHSKDRYFHFLTAEELEQYQKEMEKITNDIKSPDRACTPQIPIDQAPKKNDLKKTEILLWKNPSRGQKRYSGDLLSCKLSDALVIPLRESNAQHDTSLLKTLLRFKKEFSMRINDYAPLKNNFYTILSATVSRVIFRLQSDKTIDQPKKAEAIIESIISDINLYESCSSQWKLYKNPEPILTANDTITDIKALEILNSAFDTLRTNEKDRFEKAAKLIRPLCINRNTLEQLSTAENLLNSLSKITPILRKYFFNPINDKFHSLIKHNDYDYKIREMHQYKAQCISYAEYSFLLGNNEIKSCWQSALWKVWGLSIKNIISQQYITKQHIDDLLKLKSLAEKSKCTITRRNLKSALIRILSKANRYPDIFLKFRDELNELAHWAIALCRETEKKYKAYDKDEHLITLSKEWQEKYPEPDIAEAKPFPTIPEVTEGTSGIPKSLYDEGTETTAKEENHNLRISAPDEGAVTNQDASSKKNNKSSSISGDDSERLPEIREDLSNTGDEAESVMAEVTAPSKDVIQAPISSTNFPQPLPANHHEHVAKALPLIIPTLTSPPWRPTHPQQQAASTAAIHHQFPAPELPPGISSYTLQPIETPEQVQWNQVQLAVQIIPDIPLPSMQYPMGTAMPLQQVISIPVTAPFISPPIAVTAGPAIQTFYSPHYQALYSQRLNQSFIPGVQQGMHLIEDVLSSLLDAAGGGDLRYTQVPEEAKKDIISATALITPWLKSFCLDETDYQFLCQALNEITAIDGFETMNSLFETLLNAQIRYGNIAAATDLSCVFEGLFHTRHMIGLR